MKQQRRKRGNKNIQTSSMTSKGKISTINQQRTIKREDGKP